MKSRVRKKVRDKSKLAYGLLNVLRDDIDRLRTDAVDYDLDILSASMSDAIDTLEKLTDVMAEIEYALYLDRLKESQ